MQPVVSGERSQLIRSKIKEIQQKRFNSITVRLTNKHVIRKRVFLFFQKLVNQFKGCFFVHIKNPGMSDSVIYPGLSIDRIDHQILVLSKEPIQILQIIILDPARSEERRV